MKRISLLLLGALTAGLLFSPATFADARGDGFVRVKPDDVHWQEVPNSHGVQQAILYGNPDQPGVYVIRVRFPPFLMDQPHWHDTARYVTVLEGAWYTGTGDRFDLSKAIVLDPGSVMIHPARGVHWDGSATKDPVVVQIIGEGPVSTHQVNSQLPFWIDLRH